MRCSCCNKASLLPFRSCHSNHRLNLWWNKALSLPAVWWSSFTFTEASLLNCCSLQAKFTAHCDYIYQSAVRKLQWLRLKQYCTWTETECRFHTFSAFHFLYSHLLGHSCIRGSSHFLLQGNGKQVGNSKGTLWGFSSHERIKNYFFKENCNILSRAYFSLIHDLKPLKSSHSYDRTATFRFHHTFYRV